MRIEIALLGLTGILVLSGCEEKEYQAKIRMMKEAESCARKQCETDLVGFTRIISSRVSFSKYAATNDYSLDPKWWQAEVAAEHVNPSGGIERTNLFFRFQTYVDDTQRNRMVLLCRRDEVVDAEESRVRYEAFLKSLGRK